MIEVHRQKESIMGGIIILMTPAPIIDPFPAQSHLSFCSKEPAKGKKGPKHLVGGFGCLKLVL